MTPPKNASKERPTRVAKAKRAPATLCSTSGAGFEFEDLVSAWYLVRSLSGEQTPSGVRDPLQWCNACK